MKLFAPYYPISTLENASAMPPAPAKSVVRKLSTKNLSMCSDEVSLPEDNPRNVDGKGNRQYPFNRKILIIDSFHSQNSRGELEINSPYDKVCEQ